MLITGVTLGRDFGIFSHFFSQNLTENVRIRYSLLQNDIQCRLIYNDESDRANKAEVWKSLSSL